MRKIITLGVILSFIQVSFSQYNKDWEEAVVYLKNGTIKKGIARVSMPSSSSVSGSNETLRFTEGRKKPTVTIKSKDIDSIIFQLDYRVKVNGRKINKTRSAKFVVFNKNKKKTKLGFAELVIDGELRLLKRTVSTTDNNRIYREFEQELVQLNSKVPLGLDTNKLKSFKKQAMEYFQDCPNLVSKIENKTYKSDNIEALVKYYNDNCAK